MTVAEIYLGDGLYASFDEAVQAIKLRAPHPHGDQRVYLEAKVYQALTEYVASLSRSAAGSEGEAEGRKR